MWASINRRESRVKDTLRLIELLVPVSLIAVAWWRIGVGVQEGNVPLITWMVMAEAAVILMLLLTRQALYKELNNFLPKELLGRKALPAIDNNVSLIIQFAEIVIGNTIIVGMIIQVLPLYQWRLGDTVNACIFTGGAVLFAVLAIVRAAVSRKQERRVDASQAGVVAPHRLLKVLMALKWDTPWARCGYVIILKVMPQCFQAIAIVWLGGRVDVFGVLALSLLGCFRLLYAWRGWRAARKSVVQTAIYACTVADLMSMLVILGATLYTAGFLEIPSFLFGETETLTIVMVW